MECQRCGFQGKTRQSLVRHLQRKNPCSPTCSDVLCHVLLCELTTKHSGEHTCEYCDKAFSFASGKSKHKKNCRFRPNDVVPTTARSSEAKVTIGTQNIQTQNNIQNNIMVINAFGEEDISHLTEAFKTQCIRRTDKGFVELLEKIHFDPAKPENKNVQITNMKLPFIRTYGGQRWMYREKDEVLADLVEKGHTILSEHYEDNEEEVVHNLSESMKEHIQAWMELIESKDQKTQEQLLRKIYLLILNA